MMCNMKTKHFSRIEQITEVFLVAFWKAKTELIAVELLLRAYRIQNGLKRVPLNLCLYILSHNYFQAIRGLSKLN